MSPEFLAAAYTYGVVFSIGVITGALLDRLARHLTRTTSP